MRPPGNNFYPPHPPGTASVPRDRAPTLPGHTPCPHTRCLTYSDVPEGEHGHHHGGRGSALATEAAEHEASACILSKGSPQDLEQLVKILGGETKV